MTKGGGEKKLMHTCHNLNEVEENHTYSNILDQKIHKVSAWLWLIMAIPKHNIFGTPRPFPEENNLGWDVCHAGHRDQFQHEPPQVA